MTITTTHNGHEIRYAENEDVWRCWSVDLEAKTLSALKAKLNKLDAAGRRVGNVKAIYLGSSSWHHAEPCEITLLKEKGMCLVSGLQGRVKVALEELAPDTPEVRAAIEEHRVAKAFAKAAEEDARKLHAAIPRITPADLDQTPTTQSEGLD